MLLLSLSCPEDRSNMYKNHSQGLQMYRKKRPWMDESKRWYRHQPIGDAV